MASSMAAGGDPFDAYAAEYDAAVARGVALSGDSREYFAAGRVAFLVRELHRLGELDRVRTILDYGCGRGETAFLLARSFPCVEVLAVDASREMVRQACRRRDAAA